MNGNNGGRTFEVYIMTVLTVLASVVLTVIANVGHWPSYYIYLLWGQLLILVATVLLKRIPLNIQAFIFASAIANTIYHSGMYFHTYQIEYILLGGGLVLVTFYHLRKIVFYQTILTMIILFLHTVIIQCVKFDTPNDYMEVVLALTMLLGIGISGYVNIRREDMVREKLIESRNKAEQAEQAKADFLANMSHEIRTPMNAIIGLTDLTLKEKDLSENTKIYSTQIQNSSRNLLSIVNDILDFSKIDSGKMDIIEEEFELFSTINDVVNITATRINDKPIEMIVHIDPDIPKMLIGDELRIRQVMINLLGNAVKYTNEGVVVLKISHTVRKYGINLIVSVSDSGIGISKKNMEKLFNSFQQVDTKKNRAVEGTGLGLVISKNLITQMGGFISVNSMEGEGSEFKFVVPLKVKDNRPFINVKNTEKINAAFFIDIDKFTNERVRREYKEFLESVGVSIQVHHYMCKTFEILQKHINHGKITHCFIGRKEYIAHKDYFSNIASRVEIIVIQDRIGNITVPDNMRCIFKPIYVIPLVSVFNEENPIIDFMEDHEFNNSFVAPDAKALLVDDNLINLQVLSGLILPYEMEINMVTSGKDAIKEVESGDYDIVFMDHMMPEMDGMEATSIIRAKEGSYYQNLPIIALTANAINGAREMYLSNGFNGYVSKPMEMPALERALRQNLPESKIQWLDSNEEENESNNYLESEEGNAKVSMSAESIDINVGLHYIGNDKNAYMNVLESYVSLGKKKKKVLDVLFRDEDWKNYIIEVHALKSSSLTIGAVELSEMARKIELLGKSGDVGFIKTNHFKMISMYDTVINNAIKMLNEREV